jgi:[ribosomal protein S5]-alanine N-acetyltransferase
VAAFLDAASDLPVTLTACASGRELAARGHASDISLAAEHDVSRVVPILVDGAFSGIDPAARSRPRGGDDRVMDDDLTLRAFREEDLGFLDRLDTDPAALGTFEWFGFGDVQGRRRRWERDGFVGPDSTALAVVDGGGAVIGIVSWKAVHRGGSPGACYEVGAALLPEHRGRGLGTAAQRLLVDHLFRFTTVHRLEAGTDADNLAEQKALERIGFIREGILREVAFRDGAWRDCVLYSLLRDRPR